MTPLYLKMKITSLQVTNESQDKVSVSTASNLDMSLTETTVRNDVFLPVVSSTPGKNEDDVLQPSSSSENTDNDDGIPKVALLLIALGDENVQVEEVVLGNDDVQLDVANTEVEATEGNITTSTSIPWDIDVESIFGLPMPSSEKKKT